MDGEWNNQLKGGVLDVRTHILHGMIHSNGYGHLICINGIEGGSKFISGRETMDLWDPFCRILRASKVSLKDVSKKRSMELRLLYAVAFGHTWFGRWGYEFCSGSLGVTAATYSHAVATLSGVLLEDALVSVGEANSHKVVADIIGHYKSLSKSKLTTVRDVLRFILYISCCRCDTFKRVQPSEYKKIESILLASKNWPAGRVTTCLNSMLNFLKAKTGEVERRELKRETPGDTGLIDFLLARIENIEFEGCLVRRRMEPDNAVKFWMDDLEKAGGDIIHDLFRFYSKVFKQTDVTDMAEQQTEIQSLLQGRLFVKEWEVEKDRNSTILVCKTGGSPITVAVPKKSSVGDLKKIIEKAVEETYHTISPFKVLSITDMDGDEDCLPEDIGSEVLVEIPEGNDFLLDIPNYMTDEVKERFNTE